MATIREPLLTVERVAGRPAKRAVRVSYELLLNPADHLVDHEIDERIVVHAIDEHDAVARPDPRPLMDRCTTFRGMVGTHRRIAEFIVDQTTLDVQQDWWSSGPGGEIQPIAEWPDHVSADIALEVSGHVVARVTTPTVTGSWGPLGDGSD